MSTIGFDDLFDKEGFNSGLKALKDAIDAITRTINETKIAADGFSKTMGEELKNKINQLASTSANFDNELKKIRSDFEAFKQSVAQTNNTLDQYKKTNEELSNKVKKLEEETKKYAEAQKGANKAASDGGVTMKGLSQQLLGVASGAALVYRGITILKEQISAAVDSTIAFEKAMKEVQAISRASGTDLELLTANANRLGATTEKTATDIASLQKELAKLGFNPTEIIASTDAIVDLSTATGENLAGSATVAAATLRAFGLEATEMTRVVDVMAGSFVRSGLDLEKFRESMKLVAPIARAANIDIETTTAALSKLADAGLSGSLAGTALRNLFSNLASESSKLGKRLGFAVENSDDLIKAFRQLQREGITLSEVVDLVDVRARPAFFTIMNQIDAVEGLATEYSILNGEGKAIAEMMRDNLANDIEIANSAFDAMRRNITEQFLPSMRSVTQGITVVSEYIRFLVNDLSNLTKQMETTSKKGEEQISMWGALVKIFKLYGDTVVEYVESSKAVEHFRDLKSGISSAGDSMRLLNKDISALQSVETIIEQARKNIDGVGSDTEITFSKTLDLVNSLGEEYNDIALFMERTGDYEKGSLALKVRILKNLETTAGVYKQQENSYNEINRQIAILESKTDRTVEQEKQLQTLRADSGFLGKFLLENQAQYNRLNDILLKNKVEQASVDDALVGNLDTKVKKTTDLLTLELQLQLEQSKTAEKAFETESAASDSWMRRLDLAKGYLAEREKQIFLEYQLELRKIELTEDGEEQSQLKRLIAVEKYLQKVQALEREYNKDFVKASDDIATAAQKNGQKVLEQSMKNFDEFWGIKRKKTKDNAEKEGAILERSFQRSFNIILGSVRRATDTLFDYLGKRFERELAEVDAWEKERIKLAGDNEEAIAAIEEEAARRRAEIKRKEAKQDKAQAIFNIALNTAQAVVAALATIKGIALIPFILALGAAQAAIVAATPLPQFAKGTTNAPEGQAIVGEKGREIVWDKRSNTTYVTPDAPTLTYLSKGSVVIPNDQTERILSTKVDRNEIAYDKTTISNNRKKEGADLYKLGGMFKEAVREIPLHQTTFDADGVREFVKRGNNRTERLNRRYKY
jgi:TP901 family phage tail tape measure protein